MRTRGGQANTGTGMNAGGLGMRPLRFVAVIGVAYAALLLPVPQAHAWGPDAHRTVALIADKVLQQSDAAPRGKAPVRLSTYWRTTLVGEVVGRDRAAGAARLLSSSVSPADMQSWAAGNPESWAMESYQVAKTVTYAFPADSAAEKAAGSKAPAGKGEPDGCGEVALYRVGPDYETKALAAVKQQLAKGGLRLAQLLRDSFK